MDLGGQNDEQKQGKKGESDEAKDKGGMTGKMTALVSCGMMTTAQLGL